MSPENDKKLCEAFPRLYAERYLTPQESCMSWGFECDDGWFDLLWEVSRLLDSYDAVAAQVKEKNGLLTIYLNTYTPQLRLILAEAERKSSVICERCGQPGSIDKARRWPKVLCPNC